MDYGWTAPQGEQCINPRGFTPERKNPPCPPLPKGGKEETFPKGGFKEKAFKVPLGKRGILGDLTRGFHGKVQLLGTRRMVAQAFQPVPAQAKACGYLFLAKPGWGRKGGRHETA